MTIYNDSNIIYHVGLGYKNGSEGAGETHRGTQYPYTFKNNEFITYMKACRSYTTQWNWNSITICYLYIKTNLNNTLAYGNISNDCEDFEPNDVYAIVGFYGYAYGGIDKIGCIYKKYYYDCPKLEEGKFCNYDHTKALTEMPEGYFLNDTSQKPIDKCYSKCKKCIIMEMMKIIIV